MLFVLLSFVLCSHHFFIFFFFFSSRRRHTRCSRDWSSDVCSSDLELEGAPHAGCERRAYDAARAATLEAAGYRVIRIANRDVTRDHLAALLSRALRDRASFPLSRRERGTGGEDQRQGEGQG